MTKAINLPKGIGIPAERLLPLLPDEDIHQKEKLYFITEVFYSLQGEGIRAGEPSVFVRFRGCNMDCKVEPGPRSPGGFLCDTEFRSGRAFKMSDLLDWIAIENRGGCLWVVFTGGEPGLQADENLVKTFRRVGFKLAIETNGTIELPADEFYDWITVSPKVPIERVKQRWANELKFVITEGQNLPKEWETIRADYHLISPAFNGNTLEKGTLNWCIKLCLENPKWRLSVQQHKGWGIE